MDPHPPPPVEQAAAKPTPLNACSIKLVQTVACAESLPTIRIPWCQYKYDYRTNGYSISRIFVVFEFLIIFLFIIFDCILL